MDGINLILRIGTLLRMMMFVGLVVLLATLLLVARSDDTGAVAASDRPSQTCSGS